MTIDDFSYYSRNFGYLYIYLTPDSVDYVIGVLGTTKSDAFADDKTDDTSTLSLDPDLAWGLIYSILDKVAEINNSPTESNRYKQMTEIWKKKWKDRAEHKNTNLEQITPYSFI